MSIVTVSGERVICERPLVKLILCSDPINRDESCQGKKNNFCTHYNYAVRAQRMHIEYGAFVFPHIYIKTSKHTWSEAIVCA